MNLLRKIVKKKKGQVRGVDFALAMLIFIIAFSQIILVLTNLLIPTVFQMETYSYEQELNKLYSSVFYSSGNPEDWYLLSTNTLVTSDFKLGLERTSGELDFSKINRLSMGLQDYWYIRYETVRTSYPFPNNFAIGIEPQVKVTIDEYNIALGQISITGQVLKYQTAIEHAHVWAFAINNENSISTTKTTTQNIDDSISFQFDLSLPNSSAYTVVIFARVGDVYDTYRVVRFISETSFDYEISEFDFTPYVRENSQSASCSVDVSFNRYPNSDNARATVVFPYSTSITNFSTNLIKENLSNQGNIYSATGLPIPTSGFAVVIIHERVGDTYRAGFMGIPHFLSLDVGGVFGLNSETARDYMAGGEYILKSELLTIRNKLVNGYVMFW